MVKILFVCLGNICRSPMAEFVLKNILKEKGIDNKVLVDSAATSNEEKGNGMHYGTINKLKEKNIEYTNHIARKMTIDDYKYYDYIIAMEEKNIYNILKIIGKDNQNKVCKLLDFTNNPRDIADPWYTGDFETTYNDILEGCNKLIEYLKISK